MISDIRKSVGYLTSASKEIFTSSYRFYALGPLLVNCILFSLAIYWSWFTVTDWIDSWTSAIEVWSWLQGTVNFFIESLKYFLLLVIIMTLASFFTSVTHLLAAPLLGLLAEKVDQSLAPQPLAKETMVELVIRTFKREFQKIHYWLFRAVFVLLLAFIVGLIPVIQVLSPFIWTLFASWMLAIQYIDFGADTRAVPFPTVIARLKSKRILTLSFGLIVLGATMMPPFNLIILPVAVIAGVTLWQKEFKPREVSQ